MNKKSEKELAKAIRADVKKEMAKPRMTKSARERERNPTPARIAPGKPLISNH